jgi:hypothetical protein
LWQPQLTVCHCDQARGLQRHGSRKCNNVKLLQSQPRRIMIYTWLFFIIVGPKRFLCALVDLFVFLVASRFCQSGSGRNRLATRTCFSFPRQRELEISESLTQISCLTSCPQGKRVRHAFFLSFISEPKSENMNICVSQTVPSHPRAPSICGAVRDISYQRTGRSYLRLSSTILSR